MTSEESHRKTESCLATKQTSLDIDSKLANICGPFSWNIRFENVDDNEEVAARYHKEWVQRIVDKEEYFPEDVLINHLIQTFEMVKRNDFQSAVQSLSKAEDSLTDIKAKGTLKDVENVLQHIFIGTKCHMLKELGQTINAVELLNEIPNVNDMNDTESAMLNGCHSSALLLCTTDNKERIKCAKTAIKYEPNNGKWHYLLATYLRIDRRRLCRPSRRPCEEEASAFQEAYRLSPNALFGSSLARLYRESFDTSRATDLHKEIYELQPNSCKIRLRLALGFIRGKEYELAKNCLDYVGERMPDKITYTHYMAIFEEECNRNYEAALYYYKNTTEQLNAAAEVQYMKCKKRVEPTWDPLAYLLDLSKKYEKFPPHVTRSFDIEIGSYYLYEMCDVLSACRYLAEAIRNETNSRKLRKHSLWFRRGAAVNIYHKLAKEVEYALKTGDKIYNENQIKILKDTLQFCYQNCEDPPPGCESSKPKTLRSRTINSSDNDRRGSSSSVAHGNWRRENPGKVSLGFSNYSPRSNGDPPNSLRRNVVLSPERDCLSWRSSTSTTMKDNSVSGDRGRSRGAEETKSSKSCNKNGFSEKS